jgi:hypothetical protein
MPFPINRTANRFGNCPGAADTDFVALPHAGKDSSHGRHIVTPTPRKTVLLVIVRVIFLTSRAGKFHKPDNSSQFTAAGAAER